MKPTYTYIVPISEWVTETVIFGKEPGLNFGWVAGYSEHAVAYFVEALC
jgi:hypothetical protein